MKTDGRDEISWVAVELSPLGEMKVEDGTIAKLLRADLDAPDHPIFVPAATYTRLNRSITLHLMEGYVFMASGLADNHYFALEHKPYVSRVMSTKGNYGMRVLSVVPNANVENLRQRLRTMLASEITCGLEVKIIGGTYANLTGLVLAVEEEHVCVKITLRSVTILARLPKMLLDTDVAIKELGA